jgi:hypothetical protein
MEWREKSVFGHSPVQPAATAGIFPAAEPPSAPAPLVDRGEKAMAMTTAPSKTLNPAPAKIRRLVRTLMFSK